MSLEQKDLEIIEGLIYKNSDDIAISIARSFERLEKRAENSESHILIRLSEVEDRIESGRQSIDDSLGDLREELRDTIRFRSDMNYERA